ncbi:MAG: tRNA (adenosine(37)-N6)-threonylcarbamoyltransferase complex dimerization subunit type 1 TsaB [Candidatus Krumholzibacteria bacterium]|nr:tRNA (adenosine(37)-N6)-threonylcarbamoyltransferase complex dimerization subunit type 1 TsaB [Candidatus Krumholzibacteria bacterium]MDH4336950.1 tRNA (adenosine(37)-N6)-threonylcarbamoyltransferase complex dimerization subunit type 1 TsaB [Candidatus Krumholzibacteria bacterium]MDH5269754.1 tRNA (adenosine(37)-N6)-threonylcarbamoyltransferase complex dimerization subunit type 1 TsaB [Candidatus Krumholzibacteria bacterium]MDH5627055.1 tRNA (adenosine(37)-N6)-threonylcarbamoyltransferase com
MVTLAVDTSHPTGAVSLARDGAHLGTERFARPSSHLVALAHAVEKLLADASLTPRDVARVAVVVGPGSFTGLRIGLSFAKGLHAAGGADIVPIDSLRLLALPLLESHGCVCAMIDARRGEVYAAVYERAAGTEHREDAAATRVVVAPCALAPSAFFDALTVAPDAFVGSGTVAARAEIAARFPGAVFAPDSGNLPDTAFLAGIAPAMPALVEAAVRRLEPLYVRPSGAERVRLRRHGRDGGGDRG